MSIQYIHAPSGSKSEDIKNTGLWNIAVALERLRGELAESRSAPKIPESIRDSFSAGVTYRFTLQSGEPVEGTLRTVTPAWIEIETTDRKSAFVPVSAITLMQQTTH